MSKKLYIKTYGCQMNVYDSNRMTDLLKPHGFELSTELDNADMVIFNTCHIREKAAEKVYSELNKIKAKKKLRKKAGEDMIIAVAGCVAQAEGEEVIKRAPFVDIVVGPQSYHNLPLLIEQIKRTKSWAIDLDFAENTKFDQLPKESSITESSAYLSIQEGCDKFCHFCVVPYTRGAEYSRPVSDIYREADHLVQMGAKEITLLGQNVSAYHGNAIDGETWGLAKLIRQLAKIKELKQIRYITSHPRDMTSPELFELHATEPKLMPYLHLPIQSGSNIILKAMNRQHTRDFYLEVIEKFRLRQDMAFSSDFIVGYPGETEKDFRDTIELIKLVKYAHCYSFKYSPRPGTPAATLANQVPEEVKTERLAELQQVIMEQKLAFNQNTINKTFPVLFQRKGKKAGQLIGKSPYMQSVIVNSDASTIGEIVNVKITSAAENSVSGILLEQK